MADQDTRESIKAAGRKFVQPAEYGIVVERLNTNSLRSGGANQLAEEGYSKIQHQKICRWRGDTFNEYTQEELVYFSAGTLTEMT